MIRITHPRPVLGRQKFIGIEFRDGAATVEALDPVVEAALVQHGFTIERDTVERESESKPKTSKSRGRKVDLVIEDEAPDFATFELPDGTVIGDGKSIATLPVADGTPGLHSLEDVAAEFGVSLDED